MQVEIDIRKNVLKNAETYFTKAKKIKRKIPGIKNFIEKTQDEIENLEDRFVNTEKKINHEKILKNFKKKNWYENFRWTKTHLGKIFVFGLDAQTNEILIKKHMKKDDLIFHTENPGSPFGILIEGQKNFCENQNREVAQVLGCFSKDWKNGFGSCDVFYVLPEQVSKTANSGEYIPKGAFMIRGKKNILKNLPLEIYLGVCIEDVLIDEKKILIKTGFSGSKESCQKYCEKFVKIIPGNVKTKKVNENLKKKLNFFFENLSRLIPSQVEISKK